MKNTALIQLIGFSATAAGGVLLHFLYDWTKGSKLAAPFSGVNESTWEHMKLLYYPLLVFSLIQSRFFDDYDNFWCVKLIGILTGLLLIPVLFYTINGVFGKTPDFINIAIFFVSAAAVFIMEKYLFEICCFPFCNNRAAFIVICLIGVLFVLFTFRTPKIPLFLDPVTGKYGVKQ